MRLNLGCGNDHMDGWTNVDKIASAATDLTHDLETLPWPWADANVEEVMLKHVLEHLGQSPDKYLQIIAELYRVCAADAKITIIVPHPRHDHYLNDPTHVRPISPEGLQMFSKRKNQEWRENGLSNTPLGEIINVDFEIENVNYVPDEPWRGQLMRKEMTMAELIQAAHKFNNVISETHVVMRARK